MPKSTVLILGAGSSCSYGFPTGIELRKKILNLEFDIDEFSEMAGVGHSQIRNFLKAFKYSSLYSIDSFLAKNTNFNDVGKAAIARVLFDCEEEDKLFSEDIKDNWYRYLVNKIAHDNWDSFDPSWLKIITFNYDRSLEHFLFTSLKNIYPKKDSDIQERLDKLQIHHVYGDVGIKQLSDHPPLCFGGPRENRDVMSRALYYAASSLKVIPEGRDDDAHFQSLKKVISDSERVAFLGFSFDETNITRIKTEDAFGSLNHPKEFAATTLGLTEKEVNKIKKLLFTNSAYYWNPRPDLLFSDIECEKLLRESLIID